jgi:6-phosphogluconolactonase
VTLEIFPDRAAQADACAAAIAAALPAEGRASLIVTGGSSPGETYDALAAMDLNWGRVTVALSDDRWVSPEMPESNARLVQGRLLVGKAAAARFEPLTRGGASPQEDALAAEPLVAGLAPFAAVLLGMGEDGHIASLFPTDPNRAAFLDPDFEHLVVGVPVAGLAPFVPRISLTVAALLLSHQILILISGAAKRALVERVSSDPAYDPPVAALLRQDHVPVRVLWTA